MRNTKPGLIILLISGIMILLMLVLEVSNTANWNQIKQGPEPLPKGRYYRIDGIVIYLSDCGEYGHWEVYNASMDL